MWSVSAKERKIFHALLDGYAGDESDFAKEPLLKRRIVLDDGREGPTVGSLLKGNALSAEEVMAIHQLLPVDAPFYRFVDALTPNAQLAGGLSAEAQAEKAKREAEYRERIKRLREQQENREYMEMTKSIDMRQQTSLMKDFGQEMRLANRQMIAVTNTLITVSGAFVFGFYGIPLAYPHLQLEMTTRMILGLVFATIVLFADFYFIIKNME